MTNTYIVLGILAFMIVMFIYGKVSYGVICMTLCVLLAVTKVCTVPEAFSGFTNPTVIMIAPILVLSAAISKTSIIDRIKGFLMRQQGKSGTALVAMFFLVAAAFVTFIPGAATLAVMYPVFESMNKKGEITASRILLPVLGVLLMWQLTLPISYGSTGFAILNGLYADIINNPAYNLQFLDIFKVKIVPAILMTVFCLFAWRLMPNDNNLSGEALGTVDTTTKLSKRDETLTYVVFVAVMLGLVFGNVIGQTYMYLAPSIGVLILLYTKVMKPREVVAGLTSNMVWMYIGLLSFATAFGKTEAGNIIGNFIIGIIGEHPSSFGIILMFVAFATFMTNFMANAATQNVLIPIAASMCLAGGMDPRGIMIGIYVASNLAFAFPSGSALAALTFSMGGYNPIKTLKFTIPFAVLVVLLLSISCNFFFPVYG